mgnify:CR=1 FL=1
MSNGIGGLGGGLLDFTKNLQESSETNEEKKAKLLEIINNILILVKWAHLAVKRVTCLIIEKLWIYNKL